ncbi:MAG: hypothetical protein ABIK98_16595 [Pseudomonadota bacterium]|uniref:Uncharacterized protein n=1 Tax=Candidatus Desulfatibia profunda TaxID=2841695 RepID=A0A8J6TI72_9BACT|nr:hypothetical protein [Candidatus Desulfatibia profunda]MBL7179203.1 hypothetical protein [Desulfobacterales bacterium]
MTHTKHDRHLILRVKEDSDTPIPSAGSVAALNLLRLSRFTHRPDFSNAAEKTMTAFGSRINNYPQFSPQMLVSMIFAYSNPVQIVGDRTSQQTRSMLKNTKI